MKPQVVYVILGRSLHFYDCDPWLSLIKVSRNKRGKGEEKAKTIQKKNKKPLRRRFCVTEQKLILYLLHWIWLTKDEGSQKQCQRRTRGRGDTAFAQKWSWFDPYLLHSIWVKFDWPRTKEAKNNTKEDQGRQLLQKRAVDLMDQLYSSCISLSVYNLQFVTESFE